MTWAKTYDLFSCHVMGCWPEKLFWEFWVKMSARMVTWGVSGLLEWSTQPLILCVSLERMDPETRALVVGTAFWCKATSAWTGGNTLLGTRGQGCGLSAPQRTLKAKWFARSLFSNCFAENMPQLSAFVIDFGIVRSLWLPVILLQRMRGTRTSCKRCPQLQGECSSTIAIWKILTSKRCWLANVTRRRSCT